MRHISFFVTYLFDGDRSARYRARRGRRIDRGPEARLHRPVPGEDGTL